MARLLADQLQHHESQLAVLKGTALIPVPARVDNGMILIPRELPQTPE
jgi:hypothetical protein